SLYFDILRRGDGTARTERPPGEVYAHTAPLVGRDDELRGLYARASAALGISSGMSDAVPLQDSEPAAGGDAQAGWATVLIGDPGIGKTRLLAELTQRLDLARTATGYGRCREHGNLVSFASWRECLGQLERIVAKTAHASGDAARAAVRELLA